jgi:fibronectin-binding autotransporter adhesin
MVNGGVLTGLSLASGATSALTMGNLTRNSGATLNVTGVNLGSNANVLTFSGGLTATNGAAGAFSANGYQYFGTGAGGTVGNIVPFAEINGGGNSGYFATYTANGIAAFTNYAAQSFGATGPLAATTATDIVKWTGTGAGAVTLTANANQAVGAMVFVNGLTTAAAVAINTSGAFSVSSGAILTLNTTLGNGVTFTASAGNPFLLTGETIVFQNSSAQTNLTGPLTGSGSLVLAGNNTLSLGTAVNSYTGGTWINSGTIINGNSGNFGTGAITFSNGTLQTTTANQTFSNALNLSGLLNATTQPIVFTGPVNLTAGFR